MPATFVERSNESSVVTALFRAGVAKGYAVRRTGAANRLRYLRGRRRS